MIKDRKAFSILESLFTVMIFTITIIPLFNMSIQYRKSISDTQITSEAIQAAQQIAEKYRQKHLNEISNDAVNQNETIIFDNRQYTVEIDVCPNMTYCTSATKGFLFTSKFATKTIYKLETIFALDLS